MSEDRFARTRPFLDELDAIGYEALPNSEVAALRGRVEELAAAVSSLLALPDMGWWGAATKAEVDAVRDAAREILAGGSGTSEATR